MVGGQGLPHDHHDLRAGRPPPSPAKTRRAKVLIAFLTEARRREVVGVEALRGTFEAEALLVGEWCTALTGGAAFASLVAGLVALVARSHESCAAPDDVRVLDIVRVLEKICFRVCFLIVKD